MPARRIEIVEVSPRDGLQNEPEILATDVKLELIERAVDTGIRRIEVASFVNPKRVPQMADAEAVMAGLPAREGVTYIGLVLNRRGFDRAAAAGCREVNYAFAASDAFGERNQGMTVEQALAVHDEIAAAAVAAGIRFTTTISTAFGCPFEGEVPPERVIALAGHCARQGVAEIALADTIGVAAPTQVTALLAEVAGNAPSVPLRCHFHNTRNTGIANAYAAVEAGVSALDASIGGIGGCPFAPAATGNIPTEDLIYMLTRMGIETGIDTDAAIETAAWLERQLGRPVPALLGRAGNFPPRELRA